MKKGGRPVRKSVVPMDSVMFAKDSCIIVGLFVMLLYWIHSCYEAEMLCGLRGKQG